MGLITREGKKNYLTIFDGKIASKTDKAEYERSQTQPDMGYSVITRENKNGVVVYERHYDALEGVISNATIQDGKFGRNIELEITDVDERYHLQMGLESRYASDFMNRFPSVDLDSVINISPFSFENDEGKKITGVSLKQNGEKIEKNYTKDNPNGHQVHQLPIQCTQSISNTLQRELP